MFGAGFLSGCDVTGVEPVDAGQDAECFDGDNVNIEDDRELGKFVKEARNFECKWDTIFVDASSFLPVDGREIHTRNFVYGSIDDKLQDTFGLEGLHADGEITTISTPRMRALSFPAVVNATLISISRSEFLEEVHLPNLSSVDRLLLVREDGAPDLCLIDLSSLDSDSEACSQMRSVAGELCQRGTLRFLGCE